MALDSKRFDRLVSVVLSRRPVLKEIIEKHGKLSMYDYARQHLVDRYTTPFPARFGEFIEVFEGEVARLFDAGMAARAANQMKEYFSVSTADHHGPLVSPFFVNPSLICGHASSEDPAIKKDFVMVLPCANVSFNNSSFPRGLLYNVIQNGARKLNRLSFVSAKRRLSSLYGAPAYTKEDTARMYKEIEKQINEEGLESSQVKKLKEVFAEIYDNEKMYKLADFSDQMTVSNFWLWKSFFPGNKAPIDLIYIPLENIATQLFLRFHSGKKTLLEEVIFNPNYAARIATLFNGTAGAFNFETKDGTYLFWGLLEDKNYLVPLWKQGNELVDDTGTFRVALTPESIRDALEKKRIVPSLFFSYLVLVLWYGLRCFGGFNQVNYLTRMKQQWSLFLKEIGQPSDIAALENVDTKGLAGDLTIAYFKNPHEKRLYGAAGLDLTLYKNENTWEILKNMSSTLTLEEGIYPLVSEFYPIVCAPNEREADLSSITPDDIAEYLKLEQKVTPAIDLN